MPRVRVWVEKFQPATNPHPQRGLEKPAAGFVFWAQSHTPDPFPPPHGAKSPRCKSPRFFSGSRSVAISTHHLKPQGLKFQPSLGANKYTQWTRQRLLIAVIFVDCFCLPLSIKSHHVAFSFCFSHPPFPLSPLRSPRQVQSASSLDNTGPLLLPPSALPSFPDTTPRGSPPSPGNTARA